MFHIKLLDRYKSLFPFQSEELNGFSIITGKNGSGKTQLLYLIDRIIKQDNSLAAYRLHFSVEIKRIQVGGLEKNDSYPIGHNAWQSAVEKKTNYFKGMHTSIKELINFLLDNGLSIQDIQDKLNIPNRKLLLEDNLQYPELLLKTYCSVFKQAQSAVGTMVYPHFENALLDAYFHRNNPVSMSMLHAVYELKNILNKRIEEIEINDFWTGELLEHHVDVDDLFSSEIEVIYYNYAKRRERNDRKQYRKERYGYENDGISDDEFIRKYPPPWMIINEILRKHKINYRFPEISPDDFDPQVQFTFNLISEVSGNNIAFSELSDGEKIIIGLIIKLFTSSFYEHSIKFPDLIILDEPDAHLHPEMSKLLIDVLEETFVKKMGIKVLMSTHSPSTLALAPESAIYELKNGPDTSLRKVTKDHALKLLTSFIPTLSIDYKNHRQVFVESPTDVLYYQSLYDKHSQEKDLDYKLYFISNSMGKGNSSLVYSTTKALQDAGNSSCVGIVDWDKKNIGNRYVFVHGEGERYSIENFIIDPIYIISLLMRIGDANSICSITKLKMTEDEYRIGHKDERDLQLICNAFFKHIEIHSPALKATEDVTEVKYLNSKMIKVPNWFLVEQGHRVLGHVKKVFSALDNKYRNEGELQIALIQVMNKSYPFVPLSTIELLEKVASRALY